MWSCIDCGYVAKKANIIEHIDAKANPQFLAVQMREGGGGKGDV